MKCSIGNRILTSLNIKTIDQSIQAATDGWLSFDSSPRQLPCIRTAILYLYPCPAEGLHCEALASLSYQRVAIY